MATISFRSASLRKSAGLAFVLALACASPGLLLSEDMTMTTYYPAPYGGYNKILTTGDTLLARDGGSVGIGTNSPGSKLDVRGNASIQGSATITNDVRGGRVYSNNQPVITSVSCSGPNITCSGAVSPTGHLTLMINVQPAATPPPSTPPPTTPPATTCVPIAGSCNAAPPPCGQITYGVNNCGTICQEEGAPCPPCARLPGECPTPACNQPATGVDHCGVPCTTPGPPCECTWGWFGGVCSKEACLSAKSICLSSCESAKTICLTRCAPGLVGSFCRLDCNTTEIACKVGCNWDYRACP